MKNILALDTNHTQPLYFQDKNKHVARQRLSYKEKTRKRLDKAKQNERLEARHTVINSDFWDKFILLAKVCYMRDEEADIYDVFEIYRTKFMGGWENSPEQLEKLDKIIAKEDLKYGFSGA